MIWLKAVDPCWTHPHIEGNSEQNILSWNYESKIISVFSGSHILLSSAVFLVFCVQSFMVYVSLFLFVDNLETRADLNT